MKFTCERSALLKEIAIAQDIILSRNVISILSNIYLEALDTMLIIKSTDKTVNFETKMPVNVVEEGATTVLGDKFLSILTTLPEEELEFSQQDTKVTIRPLHKKVKFQLKSVSTEQFPQFPVPGTVFFQLPIKDFKEMIVQTVFAVSDDETRHFMNGVFCEKMDKALVMVGTDGRRLAYIRKEVGDDVADFEGVIIPPKILTILLKRAGDEGLITLSITDKMIFITFGSYQLSSALIEGQFPNYQRVIPEEQANSFTIQRNDMLDALKRVSLFVEQKSRRVYLKVNPEGIAVYSDENEIGEAAEDIPCKYSGDEAIIALNYRYLEEPFKVMSDEQIVVHFTEVHRAITIKPVPEKDFFHIVMPMQVE